jgi:hypothetical protein
MARAKGAGLPKTREWAKLASDQAAIRGMSIHLEFSRI